MKLKQEFVLRNVAGEFILIPITNLSNKFNGIITLNETSKFIWELIVQEKEKEDIVKALLEEYEVEEELATKNVDDFCEHLVSLGIL